MDDEAITISRHEWEAVLQRLATLEAKEVSATRPSPGPGPSGSSTAPPTGEPAGGSLSRRRALLGLAGAASAGVAMAVAAETPAAAANGDPLLVGNSANLATSSTVLIVDGSNKSYGLAVVDNTVPANADHTALLATARAEAFNYAIRTVSTASANGIDARTEDGIALRGNSDDGIGVFGGSAGVYGVYGTCTSDTGAAVAADAEQIGLYAVARNAIQLNWRSAEPPPERDTSANRGSIAVDGNYDVWYCITSGTPGTWRKLSGPATAGALHVLPVPKRIYDSRPGTSPAVGSKTPLAANVARVLDLKANGSGVPAGCTGAILTVLLVNAAAGNGNLTVWANGVGKPAANTMVWGPGGGRFSTQTLTGVSAGAGIQVSSSLTTDIVIDVVAYYR